MKISRLLTFTFVVFTSLLFAEENERVYIKAKNLIFNENGIFFKLKCRSIELSTISYDYAAQNYYLQPDIHSGKTFVRCGYCRLNTWWVEKNCCLNDPCPYYCF